MKNLESCQDSSITSICLAKYTYKLRTFRKKMLSYLVMKLGGARDNLCKPIAEKVNFTKLYQKLKRSMKTWPKILLKDSTYWKIKKHCSSYWNNFMQIEPPSLLPYPNNTIGRPHLTLLTNCLLVTIFLSKEQFSFCIRNYIMTWSKNVL